MDTVAALLEVTIMRCVTLDGCLVTGKVTTRPGCSVAQNLLSRPKALGSTPAPHNTDVTGTMI